MKFLVIDVYALCFRALYGYPELTNSKGEPTSVIIGFFKQVLSRVHAVEEYYPVFVTDMPGSSDVRKHFILSIKRIEPRLTNHSISRLILYSSLVK